MERGKKYAAQKTEPRNSRQRHAAVRVEQFKYDMKRDKVSKYLPLTYGRHLIYHVFILSLL